MAENDRAINGDQLQRILHAVNASHALYDLDKPLLKQIMSTAARSRNQRTPGRKPHPFNFRRVFDLMIANPWHSTCVTTKTAAHVGLGFRSPKVFEVLDPISEPEVGTGTFGGVMSNVAEDWHQTGNGLMEIVREGDEIRGVHHCPVAKVFIVIESDNGKHFEVDAESGNTRIFAPFGETERVTSVIGRKVDGELIHFRRPSAFSRDYGFPDWLAAVPFIEVVQALVQHKFDFFMNRGVPEFLLSVITDKQVDQGNWDKLEAAMQMNVGLKRAFQSIAWNLVGAADKNKVQIDKLGIGDDEAGALFVSHVDPCSLAIVSAHGVPPLIAGIQIPGKLGASNELVQAIGGFQVLKIGPAQRDFSNVLANTLGNSERNGGLGLTEEDFRPKADADQEPHKAGNGFRTIIEDLASAMKELNVADTISRMREGVDEAAAGGRDLDAGVLDQRRTATPGAIAAAAGKMVGAALKNLALRNGY